MDRREFLRRLGIGTGKANVCFSWRKITNYSPKTEIIKANIWNFQKYFVSLHRQNVSSDYPGKFPA